MMESQSSVLHVRDTARMALHRSLKACLLAGILFLLKLLFSEVTSVIQCAKTAKRGKQHARLSKFWLLCDSALVRKEVESLLADRKMLHMQTDKALYLNHAAFKRLFVCRWTSSLDTAAVLITATMILKLRINGEKL